ncbi:MAG: hypothetical protein ABIQ86_16225 [Steroidobacteraceae bacterium]
MKPTALLSLAAMVAMWPGIPWSAEHAPGRPSDRHVIAERKFADVRFVIGEGNAGRWLEMYVGGDYVGAFSEFAVDEIVAAPDGKHFLALSNTSKSSYAFAIIDRKGFIEASKPHGGDLHYCNRTSWGIGEWVDTSKPQATFSIQKNQMTTPASEYLQATVRGCDGKTVILARAPAPSLKATPANRRAEVSITGTAAADNNGTDRSSFFIGDTIKDLRDIDPTLARTLTLVDGRRSASTTFKHTALPLPANWTEAQVSERRSCNGTNSCSNYVDLVVNRPDGSLQVLATGMAGHFIALPAARRVFDCAESNGVVEPKNPVPAIVDLNGNTTSLPSHPGPLRFCSRTGTGDEVVMVYTMADAGTAYTLARVFDAGGALLTEKTFEKSGAVEFIVAGKKYSEEVPGPVRN